MTTLSIAQDLSIRPCRTSQRGFTLVEMLVVLVLTALVVGMVFEGLGRVADLRVRLARHLDGALDETITGSWFRSSVAALQTDLEGAPDAFRGGPQEMSGLTLKPIELPAGAPTAFAWRLVAETASQSVRLGYRGADGAWRRSRPGPAPARASSMPDRTGSGAASGRHRFPAGRRSDRSSPASARSCRASCASTSAPARKPARPSPRCWAPPCPGRD